MIKPMENKIKGSEAFWKALLAEGVDTVFGYPGGQIMPVYDSLCSYTDRIRHILVRHEQGAIHAAQGFARVSSRPGVVIVTSGPGATNVVTGLVDAMTDSTPLVVVTGQVSNAALGTDAFQEADVTGMTGPITKWNYQIRTADEVAWAIARAFYIARTGRPGPVVLDFTKDAQVGLTEFAYAPCRFIRSYVPDPKISEHALERAVALLDGAQKPFVVFGQGVVLGHAEKSFAHHDDNDDGFMDTPNRRQWNLMNRWKLVTDRYIMHAGLSAIKERREGGQTDHTAKHLAAVPTHLYQTLSETDRYEAYMKHAFILNPERQENIAFMASGALHQQDAPYGMSLFGNNEKTLTAQLMYEVNLTDQHQLSLGTSFSHYYNKQHVGEEHDHNRHLTTHRHATEKETTEGVYAQYTLNMDNKFTLMAGIRADYSDLWHWFVTPRLHVKYAPTDLFSVRGSIGRGYRTPHFWAEYHYLLASSRNIVVEEDAEQEKAWNMGLSTAWNIPLAGKTLKLNAEYYYTTFQQQQVVNYTAYPSPNGGLAYFSNVILVGNLHGQSYSHTFQVDATYPIVDGLTATAAWRWNDVRCTYYNGETYRYERLQRPLTSRYKGLLSLSYAPGLQLWHFDATLQLNGGGRIVDDEHFHSYEQLQAQVTREFRHFALYVGGENLTNLRQKNPVRGADNPWGGDFDATLIWGPVHGRVVYAGVRYNLERL